MFAQFATLANPRAMQGLAGLARVSARTAAPPHKFLSILLALVLVVGFCLIVAAPSAYAGEKAGDEYPYYGDDPTSYTPETVTVDRTLVVPKSFILYPGDTLQFTQDAEGADPRYMGFSSTTELSEAYGFTDGTTYLVGEVNATGENLYIYDKIVLAEDADYALYIYFNGNGGAGLKDDPDTAGINEGRFGAYQISMIEKVPLYIDIWYQLYGGSIPSGATANPTKILNPKEPTFLELNSAPVRTGEVLNYWSNTPDYVPAGEEYPAGAVSVWPVYPINSSEQYFYSDYRYSGNYADGVRLGLVANYKHITYKIKIGDVSAYEALYGSRGFLQWYDPISTYTTDYIKSQINSASSWKVVGTDTRSNLDIEGTVTASEYTADYSYYGIRAQAPADGYILSGWSITDSAGNEVPDKYKLYMTDTYAATVQDGTWNYLLCIAVHDDYYGLTLPYDKTFVVTPIFVEAQEEISQVNVTMDLSDYVGGDDYNAQEERATIVAADADKYSFTKQQTSREANVTGYVSGDYIVEPGDTLYYTAAFEANKADGYQFASTVDLMVNGQKVAEAVSDGTSVRFQDAVQQTASGGVTAVSFNDVSPGDSGWSASVTFSGISRSKANLAAEKETEYGLEGQPTTIVSFEFKINGGATRYIDFEPALCSGTETFSSTSPASMNFRPWDYTFQEGDEVSWKCYAYNFRYNQVMGWEPYEVGEAIEGSFTVGTPGETQHTHHWGSPTYTWSSDNKKVTATRTCKADASHKETETVNTTAAVTKATFAAAGKTTYTATFKNSAFKKQTKDVAIPKLTVSGVANKAYTGKAITQSLTVKSGNTTLKSGTDYTLAYKNNVNAGTATVTVTAKGANYAGSLAKTFAIKSWKRLAGANALATMEQITKEYGKATTAIVATNASFKDTLAASALAGGF
ncbi:MAG: hypothetical protein IJ113_06695, partial [Eggerthellaceae bacterium]|nr:hypothetical protein [Eggerthellaceae bacterium]